MKPKRRLNVSIPLWWPDMPDTWHSWLPSKGNVLFTLLIVALLVWAQTAGALPSLATRNAQSASTATIPYQGRLADADGNPLTDTVNMIFRLYSQASGGERGELKYVVFCSITNMICEEKL